jgi:hypothetical protein
MLGLRTSRERSQLLKSFMFRDPMVNLSAFDTKICGVANGKLNH